MLIKIDLMNMQSIRSFLENVQSKRGVGMNVLAFDLGASSGKVYVGTLTDNRLIVTEIYRFPNDPVSVANRFHWDFLRLFHEMKQGIAKIRYMGYDGSLASMAIDSWGVDFGLIGSNGELLGNPYHYRDHQNDNMIEEINKVIPKFEIYSVTGIQFVSINTINQLFAMKKADHPLLDQAEQLLMIPDLFRYFLTGEKKGEMTNASTTQLFNLQGGWDYGMIKRLGLPASIFPDVLKPGTVVGDLRPSIRKELRVGNISVTAVGEHDTASAVVSVPSTKQDFAYLSCGTWSLLGTEITQPIVNQKALEWNFTNERGVGDTFRFLKNIMGLWLLQECKRIWEMEGVSLSFDKLHALARKSSPFRSFVDPDHEMFLNPSHMPSQVQAFCKETNQPVPETKGEIVRCILESLVMKYRFLLERMEELTNKRFSGLHIVGGGGKNELLCQFTANALARPVWSGPIEASTIGNILVQFMASGKIETVNEARRVVMNSFPIHTYEPEETEAWEESYHHFRVNVLF